MRVQLASWISITCLTQNNPKVPYNTLQVPTDSPVIRLCMCRMQKTACYGKEIGSDRSMLLQLSTLPNQYVAV